MKQVTIENQTRKNEFFHVTLKNKGDKQPLKVRRNGMTKLWKTRPNDFKIPVKYGLHEYAYIDQDNAKDWLVNE